MSGEVAVLVAIRDALQHSTALTITGTKDYALLRKARSALAEFDPLIEDLRWIADHAASCTGNAEMAAEMARACLERLGVE